MVKIILLKSLLNCLRIIIFLTIPGSLFAQILDPEPFLELETGANDVAISPDGSRVLLGDCGFAPEPILSLYNAINGSKIQDFPFVLNKDCITVTYSPTGDRIATTDSSFDVTIWNPNTGEKLQTLTGLQRDPTIPAWTEAGLAFSPDGTMIRGGWPEIIIWDVDTGEIIHKFNSEINLRGGSFSHDGKYFLTGSGEFGKTVSAILWDMNSGNKIREFGRASGSINGKFSPDGKYIAIEHSNIVEIYHMNQFNVNDLDENLRRSGALRYDANIQDFAFSPDSKYLLVGGGDEFAYIYDIETRDIVKRLEVNGHYSNVDYSMDGTRVVISNHGSGNVTIWDVSDLLTTTTTIDDWNTFTFE